MEIKYNNIYFYPFSGLNNKDFENIIELITNYDNVNNFSLIFCDIFNYNSDYLKKELYKTLCFFGNKNFKLIDFESSKIYHKLSDKKNVELKEMINEQYGWSKKRSFNVQSFNFSKQNKNSVLEIQLLIPIMDSFNFFDFVFKNNIIHMSNFNLILKNPGLGLNTDGFGIFNKLDTKKLIRKVFVSNENEHMQLPENYKLLSVKNDFKIFQNTSYDNKISLLFSKINNNLCI